MTTYLRTLLAGIALLGINGELLAQANDVDCAKCIDTADIAGEAVSSYKIKPKAVTSAKLAKEAVTTSKLGPKAVTTGKIANDAVTASKIRAGAVTPGKIEATDELFNTRYGLEALFSNPTGGDNTAIGPYALWSNTGGYSNTAIGASALWSNTSGFGNTAIGWCALCDNSTGQWNTAIGHSALQANTEGSDNTAIGYGALASAAGSKNTAIGFLALRDITTGQGNIALGWIAGIYNTGSGNITIGNPGYPDESSTIRIGDGHSRTFISGIRGKTTGNSNAVNVVIDSDGQLGTISSSRRFKQDIVDMGQASDRLHQLRPVTFRYKETYDNGERPIDYGLIAEEVAEVFPELVVVNDQNEPETVKYRLLSSMLLNELQKQSAELQALNRRLEHLENANSGAIARIK